MKMDKVAGSGNDEFFTPDYAITPILKYIPPHLMRIILQSGVHLTLMKVYL